MPRLSICDRVPIYIQLPKSVAKEIRRRAKASDQAQWEIVAEAINRGDSTAKLPKK